MRTPGLLEAAKALQRDVTDILQREMDQHPDYTLTLTGHSMGGGVAALLGSLLEAQFRRTNNHDKNNRLRVYLYGAPCVAPKHVQLRANIVSVVTDGDPFCRLSLGHVADASKALDALCQDHMLRHDILLRTNQQPTDMSREDLEWCHDTMESLRGRASNAVSKPSNEPSSSSSSMMNNKLYPPGRILLLTEAAAVGDDQQPQRPSLRQVPTDYFRDLVVGPRMLDLSRHIPSRYEKTLRLLIAEEEADDDIAT